MGNSIALNLLRINEINCLVNLKPLKIWVDVVFSKIIMQLTLKFGQLFSDGELD